MSKYAMGCMNLLGAARALREHGFEGVAAQLAIDGVLEARAGVIGE